VGAEAGYGSWIYTYAFSRGLETEITSNYLTSAFWGFFTLGRLFAVWVSMRFKPLTVLIMDFAGCVVSVGAILLFQDSKMILWGGTILLGISLASIFPTFLTLTEERIHITGTITGWFLVGGGIGGMILPLGIGQAFVRFGPDSMAWIVFAGIVANILALYAFVKSPVPVSSAGDENHPLS
jgi:FHS family Na+ dependent glucose MFS transporter 1